MVRHSYVEHILGVVLSAYLAKTLHSIWIVFDMYALQVSVPLGFQTTTEEREFDVMISLT